MFPGIGSRRCRKARRLLTEYVDGRLSSDDTAFVDRHVETCEGCSEELESLRATVRLLNRVPSVPVPRSFALREADVVREKATSRPGGGPWPSPVPVPVGPRVGRTSVFDPERLRWLRPTTAVVAAALILVLALDFGQVVPQENQPSLMRLPAPEVTAPASESGVFGQLEDTLKANGTGREDEVPPPAPLPTGTPEDGNVTFGGRGQESLGAGGGLDETQGGWPMRQIEIGFGALLFAMLGLTLVVWRRRKRLGAW